MMSYAALPKGAEYHAAVPGILLELAGTIVPQAPVSGPSCG